MRRYDYTLPDGRVVSPDPTATKGAPMIGFTLKGGDVVSAYFCREWDDSTELESLALERSAAKGDSTLADRLSDWLYRDHGTTFRNVEGHDRVCDVLTVTLLNEPPTLDLGDERAFLDFALAEPWDALTEILDQARLDVPAEDLLTEFTETLEAYRCP